MKKEIFIESSQQLFQQRHHDHQRHPEKQIGPDQVAHHPPPL